MRRNFWLGFIAILIIIAAGFYISYPKTETFLRHPVTLREGLDLQGGVLLKYELDLSKTADADKAQAIESTRRVIERRVNSTGVSEPVIQPTKVDNKQAVTVELPGIKNINEAVDLIGKTAQLDFREIDPSSTQDNVKWLPTGLTGKHLKTNGASLDFLQDAGNTPYMKLEFNDEGTKLFAEITERNVGRQVAIFLDGQILQSPTVQEKIPSGTAQVTGDTDIKLIKERAFLINSGAIDVPIKLIGNQTIGATLGAESVKKSLTAGVVGLGLVMLFMIINYQLSGLIAVLALAAYTGITFAVFKYIPVTLTLAGIAGFILSIGMAVDANILIFERMREELRDGRDLKVALEESFRRAWPSVRDSNVATLITCGVLFFNTTGLVRGFALTLAIGVLVSLFSSITTSRALLRLVAMFDSSHKWLERT